MSRHFIVLVMVALAGCREGAISGNGGGTGAGGGSGNGGGGGTGSGGGHNGSTSTPSNVNHDYPCPGCAPFPGQGAPSCASATLPVPKIAYPPDGVLLPPNMNVLEVQWTASADATSYQVEFHNNNTQVTVETPCQPVPDVRGGASRGCGFTLSQEAWNDIADHNRGGQPVAITVRATKDNHCVASSSDHVAILFAEEDLAGGIYYWQSAVFGGVLGKTGGIFSHDFGTRDPMATPFLTSGASGTCVGCHSVSRDGVRMAVEIDDPDADDEYGDVDTHVVATATRMTVDGTVLTRKGTGRISPGFQAFTHDHSKLIASSWDNGNKDFTIYDGDGNTVLAHAPLAAPGTQPDLSPDDKTLVYVVPGAGTISMDAGDDHFLNGSLNVAAFDAGANTLAAPTPLLTAKPDQTFYYPSFSPTGEFVIFNAVAMAGPTDDAYYNRRARVALLHYPPDPNPVPIELPALNAAALGPRLTNSWPKWSPFVQRYQGHKLLWVTFSSNRDYGLHLQNGPLDNCYPPESPPYDQPQPLGEKSGTLVNCAQPQIWMAAIIVDPDRTIDAAGPPLDGPGLDRLRPALGPVLPRWLDQALRAHPDRPATDDTRAATRTDRSYPAFWLPFQDVNAHNHTAQWVEKVMAPPTPTPGPLIP